MPGLRSALPFVFLGGLCGFAAVAQAQQPLTPANDPNWRASSPRATARIARSEAPESEAPLVPIEPTQPNGPPPSARATVKTGPIELPNERGQVWREYDLTPYTSRVTNTTHPEQAIVDWILRETGYEVWHGDPLGVLSANTRTLKVYHTPEMHAVVADVVDRFVSSEAETQTFGVRVVTVDQPNWRARAQNLLRPLAVQTPGAQAWMLAKEDAAMLLGELRKRTDFREHSSPHLMVNNGQSTVIAVTRPKTYVKEIVAKPEAWPGFDTTMGQIDEGFTLELTPLLALDGRSIDAIVKCNVDQVEKLVPVVVEAPSTVAPRQRAKIEVPRISQVRMHERFRWPGEQVLVIGLGVVAMPVPTEPDALLGAVPFLNGPARADLLIFVENKGSGAPPTITRSAATDPRRYNGRY
ncbi:MAG: hypothetical protein K1X74_10130 [Pirellulales bacterium]|nr:hypothetical protein [Pirellulales bacterium]